MFARRAEAEGFDAVYCGDHVGHLVDGIATLGAFAGATDAVTIGLNLLVAPYRPAAVMAKGLATIAAMAPGRVIAGFGVGGEFPGEFTATGASLGQRGAYTDEALEAIVALWSGRPVTRRGRFVQLDEFQLEPAPTPPPPIWIGGRSDAALRRAVRFGVGYSPYLVSPSQLAKRRARLHELAGQAGRSAEQFTVAALVTFIPARDVDAAVQRGMSELKLTGLTPQGVQAQYLLGDDDSVIARVQEYVEAGMDQLILGCLPGTEAQQEEFYAACRRLLPTLRTLGAPGR